MIKARPTKADLEIRVRELEDAFDRLMASHRDYTSGIAVSQEWAKRVEREAEAVRFGLKDREARDE